MKLQIKYFEQSNVNFRQNLNNFIVFIFFFNGTSTSSQLKPELAYFFLLLHSLILIE